MFVDTITKKVAQQQPANDYDFNVSRIVPHHKAVVCHFRKYIEYMERVFEIKCEINRRYKIMWKYKVDNNK